MNTVSSEETLIIELPYEDITPASFNYLYDENRKTVKHLIIVQKNYSCHQRHRYNSQIVTIPDVIANLTEVESITITACIETLPKCLCHLKKLWLCLI